MYVADLLMNVHIMCAADLLISADVRTHDVFCRSVDVHMMYVADLLKNVHMMYSADQLRLGKSVMQVKRLECTVHGICRTKYQFPHERLRQKSQGLQFTAAARKPYQRQGFSSDIGDLDYFTAENEEVNVVRSDLGDLSLNTAEGSSGSVKCCVRDTGDRCLEIALVQVLLPELLLRAPSCAWPDSTRNVREQIQFARGKAASQISLPYRAVVEPASSVVAGVMRNDFLAQEKEQIFHWKNKLGAYQPSRCLRTLAHYSTLDRRNNELKAA
ncbi:hypothetical protein J6590_074304 [Homalodisca vitripennis]|nr:hypothetical protein J6590_074304 [Homalodisca vitripennis]